MLQRKSKQRLPLNGLYAFEAVARLGSFAEAANELNVTPTAVSHQVRRLEERLGMQLLIRDRGCIEVTPLAAKYFEVIQPMFDRLRCATEQLLTGSDHDVLVIKTDPTFAVKWLIPRLRLFEELYPDINIQLSTIETGVDFNREAVDIALFWGDGRWSGAKAERLIDDDVIAVCSPKFLKDHSNFHPLHSLANAPLLHLQSFPDGWPRWLKAAGVQDDVDGSRGLFFDNALLVIQAAVEGVGVGITKRIFAEYDVSKGNLVYPFGISVPDSHSLYLLTPESRLKVRKVRCFRDWINERFRIYSCKDALLGQAQLEVISTVKNCSSC